MKFNPSYSPVYAHRTNTSARAGESTRTRKLQLLNFYRRAVERRVVVVGETHSFSWETDTTDTETYPLQTGALITYPSLTTTTTTRTTTLINPSTTTTSSTTTNSSTTTMPGEDSQPPQARQRKRAKKGRSSKAKGRPPALGAQPQSSLDGQDDEEPVLPPTVVKPPPLGRGHVGLQARMEEESSRAVCLQVLLPFLLAGMGMVLAGMVLDSVQVGGRRRLLSSEMFTSWSEVTSGGSIGGVEEEELISNFSSSQV
ncbi:hypothetical protein N1851_014201 [Merluccius polli]|uniref:Uncharacterized protein n=1 Tax=Merluccius polli TaxID=89951 RepID=A0AA47P125_MERPO|nr:hypothetical protein N1851_014201 [Merluccius polli]